MSNNHDTFQVFKNKLSYELKQRFSKYLLDWVKVDDLKDIDKVFNDIVYIKYNGLEYIAVYFEGKVEDYYLRPEARNYNYLTLHGPVYLGSDHFFTAESLESYFSRMGMMV